MTRSISAPAQPRQTLLAKAIIGLSAIVALATSDVPSWRTTDELRLQVLLDERSEQRLLLTLEVSGRLYEDLASTEIQLDVTTDRAASDFVLEARSLTPDTLEVLTFGAPDAGAEGLAVRPSLESPNRASLSFTLTCAQVELEERPESCFAQAEIRVARESERPVLANVVVTTLSTGGGPDQPDGNFTVNLEEIGP